MRKSLVLKAAVAAAVIFLGATAIHAWQVRSKVETNKLPVAEGNMSTFILERHNKAHTDNLPIQVIEDYN